MHHGLTIKETLNLAYGYAVSNNLKVPQSWEQKQSAGKDWLQKFLKRNQQLSLRKPEATSLARCTSFNRQTWDEFFTNIETLMTKFNFLPHRIYNMDETALTTVHVPPKVVAGKNIKQVGQVTSAERGTLVTAAACVNASGTSIPPVFIWPRKTTRNLDHYMKGTPPGSLGLVAESRWMNAENFLKWMRHLICHTKPSNNDPLLLIMDNHISHVMPQVIQMAKDNEVIITTFPPHTTNKLQPLDISVYGPLKSHYNAVCNGWLLSNPGKTITLYDVGELAGRAITRAITPQNIISGFRAAGICPLDRHIFNHTDFLPSLVTDRSNPEATEQVPDQPTPSNPSPKTGCSHQSTSSPIVTFENRQVPSAVTPEEIRPFPTAPPRKANTNRKRGKALTLTDTPIKEGIELAAKQRAEKQLKKRRLQKKQISDSDSSEEDEEPVPLESESEEVEPEEEPLLLKNGAYVVVKYTSKRSSAMFVGQVTALDRKEDLVTVTFLKRNGASFVRPEPEDIDIINESDIIKILPSPTTVGGTARACLKLFFNDSLKGIKE